MIVKKNCILSFGSILDSLFHNYELLIRATTILKLELTILFNNDSSNLSTNLPYIKIIHNVDSLFYELSDHDILIPHCRWNNTLEAIITTMPMLSILFVFDQNYIAEMIEQQKLGVTLNPHTMTVTNIYNTLVTLYSNYDHHVDCLTKVKSDLLNINSKNIKQESI